MTIFALQPVAELTLRSITRLNAYTYKRQPFTYRWPLGRVFAWQPVC